MKVVNQTTLRRRARLSGIGVHSNAPVELTLHPAEADHGIVFLRTGLPGSQGLAVTQQFAGTKELAGGQSRVIEAIWSQVTMTELCTVIGDSSAGSVSTIEHLMSALAGLGVDNVLVEINGPEVPIMDGSSVAFVEAIDEAGIVELHAPRRYLKIIKPVRIDMGRGYSELRPAAKGFHLDVEIDFSADVIGRQSTALELEPATFRREISRARTFGFIRDVERLWKAGFALGSSLENSVALEDDRVINPEGLRYKDEFVRHKTLDAIGDLALAGLPIIGAYRSYCAGHKMNVAVLEALFSDATAYDIIEAPRVRSPAPHAQPMHAGIAAYAPDVN